MEINIQDVGKHARNMGRAKTFMLMDLDSLDFIMKECQTVMENTIGQMVYHFIEVIFIKARNKAKEAYSRSSYMNLNPEKSGFSMKDTLKMTKSMAMGNLNGLMGILIKEISSEINKKAKVRCDAKTAAFILVNGSTGNIMDGVL